MKAEDESLELQQRMAVNAHGGREALTMSER